MVGTDRCSWGSEQGQWCKPNRKEEEVVEWDLASGANHDSQHQRQLHSDDVMAVGPAYQLNPYGSLDPQQAMSRPICQFSNPAGSHLASQFSPWIFKPSKQPEGPEW